MFWSAVNLVVSNHILRIYTFWQMSYHIDVRFSLFVWFVSIWVCVCIHILLYHIVLSISLLSDIEFFIHNEFLFVNSELLAELLLLNSLSSAPVAFPPSEAKLLLLLIRVRFRHQQWCWLSLYRSPYDLLLRRWITSFNSIFVSSNFSLVIA